MRAGKNWQQSTCGKWSAYGLQSASKIPNGNGVRVADEKNGTTWKLILGAFLSAGLGFGGGTFSRVDPFTGTEGAALDARITRIEDSHKEGLHVVAKSRIAQCERRLEQLEKYHSQP